jgi:hypothetical protein
MRTGSERSDAPPLDEGHIVETLDRDRHGVDYVVVGG